MISVKKPRNIFTRLFYKLINRLFHAVEWLRWKSQYMSLANDFRHLGNNVVLDYGIKFGNPKNISIGDNVFIGADVMINAGKGGSIELHDGSAVGAGTTIITWNLDLMNNRTLTRSLNKNIFKDVVIGEGVGLGYNCTINPGVTLGRGCEVAAGSVLVSDVKDFEVVSGASAKVIGIRCSNL